MSSTGSPSWAALTVTVCRTSQSDGVKVRVSGSAVTSGLPLTVTSSVTGAVGSDVSTTVYSPLPPSATVRAVGRATTPRSSSSEIVSDAGVTVRPDGGVPLTVSVLVVLIHAVVHRNQRERRRAARSSPAGIVSVKPGTGVKSSPSVAVPPATVIVTAVAPARVPLFSVPVTVTACPALPAPSETAAGESVSNTSVDSVSSSVTVTATDDALTLP